MKILTGVKRSLECSSTDNALPYNDADGSKGLLIYTISAAVFVGQTHVTNTQTDRQNQRPYYQGCECDGAS